MCFRRFALLFAGTLLIFVATKAYASPYTDVPAGSPFAEAYTYLTEWNVLNGSSGLGKPFDPLNRAEGLKAVVHSKERYNAQRAWFQGNMPAISLFSDINQKEWHAVYFEIGSAEGLVSGYRDGTVRPGRPLTTAEALVLLHRAYNGENVAFQSSPALQNVPSQWYTEAVSSALARNLIPPTETLALDTPITRGQFFSILHRLHTLTQSGEYAFGDPVQPIAVQDPIAPVRIAPQPQFQQITETPSVSLTFASERPFAITIPKLGIYDYAINHPDDPFTQEGLLAVLDHGFGHLFSYPGTGGKMMVYHHSSWYHQLLDDQGRNMAEILRRLHEMEVGDRIYITYEGHLYTYETTGKDDVNAKDMTAFHDDGVEELILYTCAWPNFNDGRVVVYARPVEVLALNM